jgi:hypothetical protein
MADAGRTEWSDEQLVVRIAGKVFIVPAAKLESYRSSVFEKFGRNEIDGFFEKYSRQQVDAAYLRVLVAGDGDFIPERSARGKRSASKASSKTPGRAAPKTRKGRTSTSK